MQPLAPSRYLLKVTVSDAFQRKLQQAQDLMMHRIPDRDVAKVLELALDQLIAARMKEKYAVGATPRHRQKQARQRTRAIPAEIKRTVYQRDGGQCSFVGVDGRRCSARNQLEFHHCLPFGRGGDHDADNISLTCRQHNALFARRDYGDSFIAAKISGNRVATGPTGA
jgi:hypothetical protein